AKRLGARSRPAPRAAAVPLCGFPLEAWWGERARRSMTPSGAALARMGGIVGALPRHADAVLDDLPAATREDARRALLALVTSTGARGRRRAHELGPAAAVAAVVAGRLVVVDEDGDHQLAHEALATGWPRLRAWLDEERDARARAERLQRAAAEWERLGRATDGLLDRRELAQLPGAPVPPAPAELVAATRRAP